MSFPCALSRCGVCHRIQDNNEVPPPRTSWVCPQCRAKGHRMGDSELVRRMLKQTLPCCHPVDGCTGGSHCWHDEPDNIPEGWGER